MLMPKRVKYRKQQRGKMNGNAKGGTLVHFGEWGIKALEPHWITAQQLEACRIAITRTLKRSGNLWIRVFPDKPITSKGIGVRMGKGKGSPEWWVAPVKRGRVMFEIAGVSKDVVEDAFRTAAHKLPIKVRIVAREGVGGE